MVLDFTINDDYTFSYHNKLIYCSHGHHVNYLLPTDKKVNVILHGHTHIIRKDEVNEQTYINIGSITLPKENTQRCYAILDEDLKIYDINDNILLSVNI